MKEDDLEALKKELKEKEALILFLRKELKEVEALNRSLYNSLLFLKNKRKDC